MPHPAICSSGRTTCRWRIFTFRGLGRMDDTIPCGLSVLQNVKVVNHAKTTASQVVWLISSRWKRWKTANHCLHN